MGELTDPRILDTIRSLARDPRVSAVWTEIDPATGHRIWCAKGANGHPWLLATDHLPRFRDMIASLSEGNQER